MNAARLRVNNAGLRANNAGLIVNSWHMNVAKLRANRAGVIVNRYRMNAMRKDVRLDLNLNGWQPYHILPGTVACNDSLYLQNLCVCIRTALELYVSNFGCICHS